MKWLLNNKMKPVSKSDRRIANIYDTEFKPWVSASGENTGESLLQLNDANPDGVGFHVYRMAPGITTTPHRHTEDEEFFLLEGDLRDNDGTAYRVGDLVWMKKDTEHCSYSENGCTLLVYIGCAETPV